MTERNSAGAALTPEKVAALLESALRARKNGNLPAARALLRVLAAEQPNSPQVWLALAAVAETRAEQRQALERIAKLDPQNPLARRGLARMGAVPPALAHVAEAAAPPVAAATTSVPAPTHVAPPQAQASSAAAYVAPEPPQEPGVGLAPALTPVDRPADAARALRWPLYLVLGVSLLAVLFATVLIRGASTIPFTQQAPSPGLPGSSAASATEAVAALAAAPALPAETPAAATMSLPSPTPTVPLPSPTLAAPTETPRPTLPIGEVVEQDSWHVVLLRPDYAVPLEGSIGTLQPRGRFVLALVAVGNDGPAPARIPTDLLSIVDQSGVRYLPQPSLSTAYLNAYGRGQHGDLSMEDDIPADGGNKSVPLIFDLPASARQLLLVVRGNIAGWPIGQ